LFNKFKEYPVEYLLLAITICLQFYRLGIGEIQSWDEALYVIRAKACLTHGAWLDQTQFAVGGLYSSTHPPLLIWIMALFVNVFGESEFVWRLPSAIFACVGIIAMYKTICLHYSNRTGLLTAILFGNAQLYIWYGHHAQLDIAMHTVILIALYYYLQGAKHNTRRLIIAGVVFGLSLLIKAFQPLYVLPFLLVHGYLNNKLAGLRTASVVIVIGVVLAFPWYLMMAFSHNEYLLEWSGLFGSLASGTYHVSSGSWWYYINQSIVNFPFVVLLVLPLLQFDKYRFNNDFVAAFIWFVIMLVFVSLVQTNMPHFILFLLLPASLITATIIESIPKIIPVLKPIMVTLLTAVTLWSLSSYGRNFIFPNNPYTMPKASDLLLYGSLFVLFLLSIYAIHKRSITSLLLGLISLIVISNIYRWYSRKESVYTHGARQTAKCISELGAKKILVLHREYPHENLQPQLGYYTSGWTLGWLTDKKCALLPYPDYKGEIYDAVIVSSSWYGKSHPSGKDSVQLNAVRTYLSNHAKIKLTTAQYEVFAFE
jgi:4-amino-4-deoxy-L-arabinose transferase-like glycosyltransferase